MLLIMILADFTTLKGGKTVKILVPTAENKYCLWPDDEIRKKLLN